MKKHKRYRNQIKDDKQKEYDEMEPSQADMTDFRRPAYAVQKAIRVQAEQLRENPAEYVARKYGIRGDVDGQKSNLRLRGCESSGKRD